MGLREREPWMRLIDRLDVPDHVKKLMRVHVQMHDQSLSTTIGNMELLYLRLTQSMDEAVAKRLHGTLVRRIAALEQEVDAAGQEVATAQAALAQAQTALAEAEHRRDVNLADRAEHARLASIANTQEV